MASVSSFQCLGLHSGWQQSTARLLSLPSPQDIIDHTCSRSPWALPRCRVTNIRVEDTTQNPGFGWEKSTTSHFYNFALHPKQAGNILDSPPRVLCLVPKWTAMQKSQSAEGRNGEGSSVGHTLNKPVRLLHFSLSWCKNKPVQGSSREVQPNLHSKRS